MNGRTAKILLIIGLSVLGVTPVLSSLSCRSVAPHSTATRAAKDNEELTRLFQEDQGDRSPEEKEGRSIDWTIVQPRDKARESRVKELYSNGSLLTGADYYHIAMILQHAETPDDYLLAHELCIVAISKGEQRAKWLAAASEDRFLMTIGRPQRFGTQYRADGPNAEFHLYPLGEGVTDDLRRAFDVPKP